MSFDKIKVFPSSEGNVWKYVFTKEDAVAEAVLYRYNTFEERTVICCSVQSGCAVGCIFCGTGNQFIRNLTGQEIVDQVCHVLRDKDLGSSNTSCTKFQIMFMSMGEPMHNMPEVKKAISRLGLMYPNADLLLSTVGIDDDKAFKEILALAHRHEKVGLQFSIHNSREDQRDRLIPFKKKMSLRKIREAGMAFHKLTGRKVYLNYCVDGRNTTKLHRDRLKDLFSPSAFAFTFSVVCSSDESQKDAGYRELDKIQQIVKEFTEEGYNTRMFDPAGQDDIGGGCGQLFYVQKWLRNLK